MARGRWQTSLFDCLNGKDVGPFCFTQVCFCGPCTWGSAITAAGVRNADFIATGAVVGALFSSQDSGTLVETGAYILGRRKLVRKYGIDETPFESCLIRVFCSPCAECQEINQVLVKEKYVYGCASVVPEAPRNRKMSRSHM